MTTVTTRQETPVFFRAGKEELFGVLTAPLPGEEVGTAAILVPGGKGMTSTHRNRMWVLLARQLAADGFHTMRVDYRGVGESTGFVDEIRLDRPHTEDVIGAAAWLRDQGIRRFVLIGSCFGARTHLAAASEIEGVRGLVLISLPVRKGASSPWVRKAKLRLVRLMRRLGLRRQRPSASSGSPGPNDGRRPAEREGRSREATPLVINPLRGVVSSGTPVLFLYGTADKEWRHFEEANAGEFGRITRRGGDSIEVVALAGPIHRFTVLDMQRSAIREIRAWLDRRKGDLAQLQEVRPWTSP